MTAAGRSAFRFLFMADCQLGCYASFSGMAAPDTERYAAQDMVVASVPRVEGWEWDARQLQQAVRAANRLRPDFVILGGDMVDDPESEGQYSDLLRLTAQLDDIPIHWVPGNHDAAFDCVAPTTSSLAAYRGRFGPDHYAFEHAGVTFVVVNTVIWDHPEHVAADLDRELAFLEMTLRDARQQRSRHILVFGHHPLFTTRADEPDSYWNIPGARRTELLDMLRAFGIRAFFCGHWHRNGGGWDNGLEVVVTGPVGYPLGSDPSGFRIIDVTDDEVDHWYVPLESATT